MTNNEVSGVTVDLEIARRVLDPKSFELFVFPTEKCNFRCTYCYEDFAIGKMKPWTVNGLKSFIARRVEDLDTLYISWFGGEPLLAAPIVLEVSRFARDTFASAGKRFVASITTNAYLLTPELFRSLLDGEVRRFQITLDGPQEVHDRTRRRADGHGTFDRIWANLLALAEQAASQPKPKFHVILRVHYDARTAYQLVPLLSDLKTYFQDPEFFSVHFHAIEQLGGPNDSALESPSEVEHDHVRGLMAAMQGDAGTQKRTLAHDAVGYVCYAARANSLAIRADGRIAKCTVALNDDRNTVGRLMPDGSVEIDHERLRPWLRGLLSGRADELACPWQHMPR